MAPLTPPPPVLLAVPEPLPPGPLAQSRFSTEDVTPTMTSSPLELPVLTPIELPQPEPTPPEALRPPGIQPLVSVPSPGPAPRARAPRPAMEVRRLSPTTLAFRLSPQDSWVLVRARTPLDMHMVADLETFRPDSHEFTLDITVDSQDEDASHAAP